MTPSNSGNTNNAYPRDSNARPTDVECVTSHAPPATHGGRDTAPGAHPIHAPAPADHWCNVFSPQGLCPLACRRCGRIAACHEHDDTVEVVTGEVIS